MEKGEAGAETGKAALRASGAALGDASMVAVRAEGVEVILDKTLATLGEAGAGGAVAVAYGSEAKPCQKLPAFQHAAMGAKDTLCFQPLRPNRPSLTSWNIDAFSSRPVARAKLILDHILEGSKSPDIIFLQEATPDVWAALLNDEGVRTALLVTDAEDQMSFEGMPFAIMMLLSSVRFASGPELRKEGDRIEGGGKFLLGGRIIAGNFSAISPEDEGLIDKNSLVDEWVALHRRAGPGGAMWGVGVEQQNGGLGLGRLD
ncbi:hypothetical protein F5148DRAFT_1282392 [Russula earlei]|uniref:Uncharacterized protein n=1 Tax=Russula earlei TaxID=71964 RepID=A0ACC0UFX8_9AGAM|nr:hypothetical protein F5148DRAFT_1282392 [Russula earlei]